VVLGEVSKRAMGGLGLGSGNTLADKVIIFSIAMFRDGQDIVRTDIRPDNLAFFISCIRPDTGFHCWISGKAGNRISDRLSDRISD
jgi:hypothetical protein